MLNRLPLACAVLASVCLLGNAAGQTLTIGQPHARITQAVNEAATLTLNGNVHPLVAESSSKAADESTLLEHLILFLKAAVNHAAGGAAVFHDITTGNNSVPGVTGFSATTGYDLATGLGSVDAAQLVNHWTDTAKVVAPSISLAASSMALTAKIGQTTQTIVTSTASSTLKAAVTLSVAGAPAGVTTPQNGFASAVKCA